jgi:recombination protein RecA
MHSLFSLVEHTPCEPVPDFTPQQANTRLDGDPSSPQQTNTGLLGGSGPSPQEPNTRLVRHLSSPQAKVSFVEDSRLSPQQTKPGLAGLAGVVPASRLERPAPLTVSCGIAEVDRLINGLPRGALTEICGQPSSGRSSLLLAALAETTRRQEICALVDTGDSFDPVSAAAAGVDLGRLLWIRCGKNLADSRWLMNRPAGAQGRLAFQKTRDKSKTTPGKSAAAVPSRPASSRIENREATNKNSFWWRRMEQALKATDLLLQGGGFGLVAVDMADVPPEFARRVPLASWFRFQRAVEHTPTVLLVLEQEPYAKTCASLVLKTASTAMAVTSTNLVSDIADSRSEDPSRISGSHVPAHARLFRGFSVQVEIVRSRLDGAKKPVRSAGAGFATGTEWVG